ncbi:hypothetical protein TSACC_21483 [Terrimicrobium sacchariphilum]|uniref:Uncharacterized protein n=1 Tax=Terrimicrobium sacchariphilum TaxID=690879 RepID=A0A146G8S2_TERSA|nr:hypothetical protein TSACC_21483 [Terrimicrobium sacchariphilum]
MLFGQRISTWNRDGCKTESHEKTRGNQNHSGQVTEVDAKANYKQWNCNQQYGKPRIDLGWIDGFRIGHVSWLMLKERVEFDSAGGGGLSKQCASSVPCGWGVFLWAGCMDKEDYNDAGGMRIRKRSCVSEKTVNTRAKFLRL